MSDTCAICFDDIKTKQPTRGPQVSMLRCQHYFHTGCIQLALQKTGPKCPMCRQKVMPGPVNGLDLIHVPDTLVSPIDEPQPILKIEPTFKQPDVVSMLHRDLHNKSQMIEQLSLELESANASREAMEEELQEMEKELQDYAVLQVQKKDFEDKVKIIQKEKTQLQSQIKELKNALNLMKAASEQVQADANKIQEQYTQLVDENDKMKQKLKTMHSMDMITSSSQFMETWKSIEPSLESMDRDGLMHYVLKLQKQMYETKKNNEIMKKKLYTTKDDREDLKRQLDLLKPQLEDLKREKLLLMTVEPKKVSPKKRVLQERVPFVPPSIYQPRHKIPVKKPKNII